MASTQWLLLLLFLLSPSHSFNKNYIFFKSFLYIWKKSKYWSIWVWTIQGPSELPSSLYNSSSLSLHPSKATHPGLILFLSLVPYCKYSIFMPRVISNRALNILCRDLKEIIYSVILIYKFMGVFLFFPLYSEPCCCNRYFYM